MLDKPKSEKTEELPLERLRNPRVPRILLVDDDKFLLEFFGLVSFLCFIHSSQGHINVAFRFVNVQNLADQFLSGSYKISQIPYSSG